MKLHYWMKLVDVKGGKILKPVVVKLKEIKNRVKKVNIHLYCGD